MWTLDIPRCYFKDMLECPLGIYQHDTKRRSIYSEIAERLKIQMTHRSRLFPNPLRSSGDRNIEVSARCLFSMNGAEQYLWDLCKAVQPLWK